jgi:hypothetical protein
MVPRLIPTSAARFVVFGELVVKLPPALLVPFRWDSEGAKNGELPHLPSDESFLHHLFQDLITQKSSFCSYISDVNSPSSKVVKISIQADPTPRTLIFDYLFNGGKSTSWLSWWKRGLEEW